MPQARRSRRAFLWLSLVLLAAGCGDTVTAPNLGPYGSITITAPSDTTTIGSTLTFSAVVTDTSGNPVSVPVLTWQSSNTTVATIDGQGRLTPRTEGTTVVHASGGGVISNAFTVVVIQDIGWVDQSPASLTLNNLNGVHFYDRVRGWAVGDVGTILATDDAGLTWGRQTSNSAGFTLNAVFFPTATHGFVVGAAGRVLETTNGGSTWSVRTGIPNAGLSQRDIFFVDANHGWIVGNAGLILRTKDAGATWNRDTSQTILDLYSVWAATAPGPDTTVWAVGAQGEIVGSDDGGETWTNVPSPSSLAFHAVVRRSRDDAFAVGAANLAAQTINIGSGPDWQLAPAPIPFTEFYGLAWAVPSQLMAVGETTGGTPAILRSMDNGATWSPQTLPSSALQSNRGLRDVWFVDGNYGWAVGKQGTIVHTATGGT